jgi:hypothetical protein
MSLSGPVSCCTSTSRGSDGYTAAQANAGVRTAPALQRQPRTDPTRLWSPAAPQQEPAIVADRMAAWPTSRSEGVSPRSLLALGFTRGSERAAPLARVRSRRRCIRTEEDAGLHSTAAQRAVAAARGRARAGARPTISTGPRVRSRVRRANAHCKRQVCPALFAGGLAPQPSGRRYPPA